MATQMIFGKLNEAGDDAIVSEWMVKVGEKIVEDAPVVIMETDKVSVEVSSTVTGKIVKLLVKPGDVVSVGQPILEVE